MAGTEYNNMLRQILIGVLILLVASSILGATGWNFIKVSEIPEQYVKKTELIEFIRINREDHKAIECKLDKLLELILQHQSFEIPTNYNVNYGENE